MIYDRNRPREMRVLDFAMMNRPRETRVFDLAGRFGLKSAAFFRSHFKEILYAVYKGRAETQARPLFRKEMYDKNFLHHFYMVSAKVSRSFSK